MATPSTGKLDLASERLLTIGEATKFLGMSRSSLYNLMDSGELAYCKIRGSRRIPFAALRNCVTANLVTA